MGFQVQYTYELINKITPALQNIQNELNKTARIGGKVATSLSDKFNKVGNTANNLGKKLSVIVAPLGVLQGLALKQAMAFEKMRMQLEVLTGSAEEGQKAFAKLVDYGARTPFELKELVSANNLLLGFGASAENSFKMLKTLGDISGATGQDLGGLALVLGQVMVKNQLYGQEALQFAERQIGIYNIIADYLGVDAKLIKDAGEKGQISFDLTYKALERATQQGGKFHNGVARMSTTLGGLYSTLKDSVNIGLADYGGKIADATKLSERIPMMSSKINELVKAFSNLAPETQKFVVYGGLIATVLGPALMTLGQFSFAMSYALRPLNLLLVGITSLVGLLAYKYPEAFQKVLQMSLDFTKALFGSSEAVEKINAPLRITVELLRTMGEMLKNVGGFLKFLYSGEFVLRGAEALGFNLDTIGAPNNTISMPQTADLFKGGLSGELNINVNGLSRGSNIEYIPTQNSKLKTKINSSFAS